MFPRTILAFLAVGASTAAAQDGSGADILDIARRAAVVDQILADHGETFRESALLGTEPVVRLAYGGSYYLVSGLALQEGTEAWDVELNRAYSGFLVDWLGPRDDLGRPKASLYIAGGGMSYGLQRPYVLPVPDAVEEATLGDLAGEQYTDEQYQLGGHVRSWSAEVAWARGQVLSATGAGQADFGTLDTRLQRLQVSAGGPFGVRASTRWALGGPVENVKVGVDVTEAVSDARGTAKGDWVPRVDVGFRRSAYGSSDRRDNPLLVGAGVHEELGWLIGGLLDGLAGSVRAGADADLSAGDLQLALVQGEVAWERPLIEAAVYGGASVFRDDGLVPITGSRSVGGGQVGGRFAMGLYKPTCAKKNPDCRPFATKFALAADHRSSWAEELRYIVDFARKPQTYVYFEFMGGK